MAGFTPYGIAADLANLAGDSVVNQAAWRTDLKGNQEVLLDKVSFIRESLLEATCKETGQRRLSDTDYARFQSEVDGLEKKINAYRTMGQWLFSGAFVANTAVWGVKDLVYKKLEIALESTKWAGKGTSWIRKQAENKNDFWKKILTGIRDQEGWGIADNWVGQTAGFVGDQLTGFTGFLDDHSLQVKVNLEFSDLPLFLPGQMDNYIRLGYNENYAALEDLINRIAASFQPCGDPKPDEDSGLSGDGWRD